MRNWTRKIEPTLESVTAWIRGAIADRSADVREIEEMQRKLGFFTQLYVNTTETGNVGTGEDNLLTYTVPAGILTRDGQYLVFEGTLSAAANGNNKTFKIYWGSTTLYDSGAVAQNDGDLVFKAVVIRTGAATQKCIVTTFTNMGSIASTVTYTEATEDLTGSVTFKCTGEATNDDDIVQEELRVIWYNAIVGE